MGLAEFHRAAIVGVTKGVGELAHLTPEQLIIHMARVSNPDSQRKGMSPERLIRHLVARSEWSPFDMVQVDMEVLTTRDVSRQVIRHWSARFQEFSQRYAVVDALPETPNREARLRHPTNRQASVPCEDELITEKWDALQSVVRATAQRVYTWALENNIAPEVARAVLPEGLTATRYFMAGSLRTWLHYCQLRLDSYVDKEGQTVRPTQKEHREVAASAWSALKEMFPVTCSVFEAKTEVESEHG